MLTGWRKVMSTICCCLPQRYIVSLMGFFAVANAYTMRVCLNVAITVMVTKNNHANSTEIDENACPANSDGSSSNDGEFEWSEATQGLILSSFFWGYVITHLPGGILAEKFGGKYALSLGILCTAVFTLLTPVVTRAGGSGALIALRVIQGLGEGSTFPALNVLLANWAPPQEKSRLGSFAFSGSLLGTVVGQAISGWVLHATDNDWPQVFYLFGGLAILWFLVFTLICYNDPHSHPFITDKELKFLDENLKGIDRSANEAVIPWKAMATSVPLWGLICAQVGHDWVFFTMVTDLPKYMSDVLKFNIKSNGFLSALPYLVMFITTMLTGYMCDFIIKKKWWSVTVARKFFTTVASIGPAAFILGASFAGCNRYTVVALFAIGMGFMGAFYPGMKVNALDLSPNFAGILMAIVNGIGAFTGIITPYLVGLLTPDSTLIQWRTVFWIVAGVALVTNLVFVLTASGEIQPWNEFKQKDGGAEHGGDVKQDVNANERSSHGAVGVSAHHDASTKEEEKVEVTPHGQGASTEEDEKEKEKAEKVEVTPHGHGASTGEVDATE